MVCYHPITAYYPIDYTRQDYYTGEYKRDLCFNALKLINHSDRVCYDLPNGSIYYDYVVDCIDGDGIINPKKSYIKTNKLSDVPSYISVKLPCGKCIGCALDKSRDYATRAIHEERMFNAIGQRSSFVTLTFNEKMLRLRDVPNYRSIYRHELQGFIKRLRERIYDKYGCTVRIFACGEYGEKHKRPHYHLLIFGFDFPDKIRFKYRGSGENMVSYYRSPFLEKLWSPAGSDESNGYSVIGDVNAASCFYVAKYCTKKIADFDTDYSLFGLEKPFLYTPHRPGLGYDYFIKYHEEILTNKCCSLHNGFHSRIPNYYKSLLKNNFPDKYEKFKLDNLDFLVHNLFVEGLDKNTERLQAQEELQKFKLEKSIRAYEELSNLHNIYY